MPLLEGKCALVTGAAGGIGKAAALTFAREGARVVLTDLSADRLAATADLIRKSGGSAIAIEADITDETSVKTLIERAVGGYGRLDCAFNNAGISSAQVGMFGKKLADWPSDVFDRVISINLRGTFLCMKYEIMQMLKQGAGAIVNASSLAGIIGRVGSAGYSSSKHGVVGLTKTASIEYAGAGVRVNALCPGVVATEMTQERMGTQADATLAKIPLGRIGRPEEVANLAAWLCSDRASFVTGAIPYNIDGGQLAG